MRYRVENVVACWVTYQAEVDANNEAEAITMCYNGEIFNWDGGTIGDGLDNIDNNVSATLMRETR